MSTCAFLTLADPTGYHIDDHLAADALTSAGWTVETIPWSDTDTDWARFDVVVVRSTWDYFTQVDAFFEALDRIQAAGPRLFNDPNVMRWNADKRYLADLAERGVDVVPTLFGRSLERGDTVHFSEVLESVELVIKPVRGANADGAFRLSAEEAESDEVVARYRHSDFMVQPFINSITENGEVSLFYFGGRFSHAIRKTPKDGDFRVQEEHGGTIVPWVPNGSALAAGEGVMAGLEQRWPDAVNLYARVDLVHSPDEDGWWLMELEAIEPSMYFRMDPDAPGRFVAALARAMG